MQEFGVAWELILSIIMYDYNAYRIVLRYFPHETKATRREIYAWKMSRVGGASSTGTLSLEEHLVGGTEFSV